jgi:transposase InsO family protein
VAQSTVAKYMASNGEPSGQCWGTFLRNHMPHIAAMDLFVVPTIGFVQLYVLVIVRLARRELVWINVTAHPTAEWIAQQITEAFPWNETPRYLIRDRDGVYGAVVTRRLRAMGIRDKPIAPGSPWQNPYAERLIGTLRRECLDHILIFGERHLRRLLASYSSYYNTSRTHRSLDKDAPVSRPVQRIGRTVSRALLGGPLTFESEFLVYTGASPAQVRSSVRLVARVAWRQGSLGFGTRTTCFAALLS